MKSQKKNLECKKIDLKTMHFPMAPAACLSKTPKSRVSSKFLAIQKNHRNFFFLILFERREKKILEKKIKMGR